MPIGEILAWLMTQGVCPSIPEAVPVSMGAGGAKLYVLHCGEERYVLKLAHPSFRPGDMDWLLSCRKEAAFYRLCGTMPETADFVPEVRFAGEHPAFGVLLVMAYHEPVPHGAWNEDLLESAMDTCARLHSMDPALFAPLELERTPCQVRQEDAEQALAAWEKVLAEHPGVFIKSLLTEVYRHLNEACGILNRGPFCLCHGDFHPENLLWEKGRMYVCDWQNLHRGKPVGDVSFFCSRGRGFGIPLEEEKLLAYYCGRLSAYTGVRTELRELHRERCAASLMNVFMGWPYWLTGCTAERVAVQWNEMTDSLHGLLA